MSDRSFENDPSAKALLAEVEAARRRGDWSQEHALLRELLRKRLAGGPDLGTWDRVAAERFADLCLLLGDCQEAEDALAGLEGSNRRAGFLFAADHMALKRVHVALASEDLEEALRRLESLESRIGPLTKVPWQPQ